MAVLNDTFAAWYAASDDVLHVDWWADTDDAVPWPYAYVDDFWLPLVGPTSLVLARRLARTRTDYPMLIRWDKALLSRTVGLGDRVGQSSALARSLGRLVQFGWARVDGKVYELRQTCPMLNPKHVRRLPPQLAATHDERYGDDTRRTA